jgi:hypothetical protein
MYMHDDDSTRTNFDLLKAQDNDFSMATQGGTLAKMRLEPDQSTASGSDSDYSESSFGNDFSIDVSGTSSFMIGDDEDLDELEKALEVFAAREEKQRNNKESKHQQRHQQQRRPLELEEAPGAPTKKPPRRSKSDLTNLQTPEAAAAKREAKRGNRRRSANTALANEDDNDNRSVGSNKSLPLSALYDHKPDIHQSNHSKRSTSNNGSNNNNNNNNIKAKLSNSNRSLTSICNLKDQLSSVFGDTSFVKNIHWDSYFQQQDQDDDMVTKKDDMTMTDELERAIRSKKVHRLNRLANKGVNMNARNQQGESVVSLVCRVGSAEQLVYLMKSKVSVRVRDNVGKTPLHEVAWAPTFQPSIAMMLMTDSPELLWAPDSRGYLALDYAPKRCLVDWYEFLELKQPMLRLALQFSRFKASSNELNRNQERLRLILQQKLQHDQTHNQPHRAAV